MKPINLIIDGNNLFHKTRSIVMNYMKFSGKFLDSEKEQQQFIQKIATDFINVINIFEGFENIVFCKDNHSWRKSYYDQYKANRNKDENLNWSNFYMVMEEFMNILTDHGIIISSIENAEADDLMYLWNDYFLSEGSSNNILITSDLDLTQLIQIKNGCYTIMYNNNSQKEQLYIPENFEKWLSKQEDEEIDIFNMNTSSMFTSQPKKLTKKYLENINNHTTINKNIIILTKILIGDDGDNIPSVWEWKNKSGKKARITSRLAKIVCDNLIKKYGGIDLIKMMELKNYRTVIKNILEKNINMSISFNRFDENFHRNYDLIYLNKSIIPEQIQNEFNNNINNLTISKTSFFNKEILLKDTRFTNTLKIVADVFDI